MATNNIKKSAHAILCVTVAIGFATSIAIAQQETDTIFLRQGIAIGAQKLKKKGEQWQFWYQNTDGTRIKTRLLTSLVDSISRAQIAEKAKKSGTPKINPASEVEVESPWQTTLALGFNLGNVLVFNAPSGGNKSTFSLSSSIDASLGYQKEGHRFQMSHELHYLFGVQKEGTAPNKPLQRANDDLNTFHDVSVGFGKKNRWSFNLIAKTSTAIFTIYDGNYFKDVTGMGKTLGWLSPYDITLSPGIKYQPNRYLKVSISPYSVRLFGVKNQDIANTGFYTQDPDGDGIYDQFEFTRLGAEVNVWYDRKIKQWLQMQYRIGISSNYFENIAKNGLLDGLFITRLKLFKDCFLMHRATLKGDFSQPSFKPFYSQTILLAYAKTFGQ